MRRGRHPLLTRATIVAFFVVLFAAGGYAATVVELHVVDPPAMTTTLSWGKKRTVVVQDPPPLTITDIDTLPDAVTVTVTGPTTTAPPATTTTEPPPSAPASLYLTSSGSDTAACTLAAPCRSFARAYALAADGATVSVGAGVYPSQFFAGGYLSSQPEGTKQILFRGEPGNAVRQIHFGSPMVFDGIHVDARGAKLGGSDGALFENGGAPFTFRNGSVGNVGDQKGVLVDGPGIVFDNVLFHDVVLLTAGVHSECIFAEVPEGMILRNSTFRNCAVMDLFFVYPDWWSPLPQPYGHVTLEGNSFGAPVGTYSVYIAKIGTSIAGSAPVTGWRIRNNDFGSAVNVDAPIGTDNVFCGNTGRAPAAWTGVC